MLGLPDSVEACLFDLDGVLTQTATVHAAAWKEMFDEYLRARAERTGERFEPFRSGDYDRYVDGKPRADGTRSFLQSRHIDLPEGDPDDPPTAETVNGLGNRKNDLVQRKIRTDGVQVYDGSVAYVRRAKEAGLHRAVVSSSANTAEVLESVGISDLFEARIDGVVARERHLAGKPRPDTFLAGAAALGVAAGRAAVFEDALAGVAAGKAGQFGFVVGVNRLGTQEHTDGLRENGADVVVADLSELSA